jgi:hypothetical protein
MFKWKKQNGWRTRCVSCSILAIFWFLGTVSGHPEETKTESDTPLDEFEAAEEPSISGEISAELAWLAPELLKLLADRQPGAPVHARSSRMGRGDFGGELALLKRYHSAPQSSEESNHYIDLWSGQSLAVLARLNGLTNNHALFVDSHGKGDCSSQGSGYGYFPHATLLEPGQPTPYYSARDLARVLGPDAVRQIHNVVLAGCNAEGRFRSSEVRRHFPNATNITYMTPGQFAYKPMFYQAIVLPAADIRTLYTTAHRTNEGRIEAAISTSPSTQSRPLAAYVADLYLPEASKPYRRVPASRELLDGASEKPAPLSPGCIPASGKNED